MITFSQFPQEWLDILSEALQTKHPVSIEKFEEKRTQKNHPNYDTVLFHRALGRYAALKNHNYFYSSHDEKLEAMLYVILEKNGFFKPVNLDTQFNWSLVLKTIRTTFDNAQQLLTYINNPNARTDLSQAFFTIGTHAFTIATAEQYLKIAILRQIDLDESSDFISNNLKELESMAEELKNTKKELEKIKADNSLLKSQIELQQKMTIPSDNNNSTVSINSSSLFSSSKINTRNNIATSQQLVEKEKSFLRSSI